MERLSHNKLLKKCNLHRQITFFSLHGPQEPNASSKKKSSLHLTVFEQLVSYRTYDQALCLKKPLQGFIVQWR